MPPHCDEMTTAVQSADGVQADRPAADRADGPRRSGPRRRAPLRTTGERDQLALANTGLVNLVLKLKGLTSHPAVDDLHQAGLIGLLRAAELFDARKQCEFSTYAVRWIKQGIWRELGKSDLITIPHRFSGDERRELSRRTRPVTFAALARGRDDGIDRLLPAQSSSEAADALEQAEEAEEAKWKVRDLLRTLPPREAEVLRRRVRGETLAKIGKAMRVCRETARQLEERAMEKLRRRCRG